MEIVEKLGYWGNVLRFENLEFVKNFQKSGKMQKFGKNY